MNIRVFTVALSLGACLLCTDPASSQPPNTDPATPTLTARIETHEYAHSFAVRFFLKNNTDRDAEVIVGRGGSGLEVVPRFHLNDGSLRIMNPPTYLGPARRSMKANLIRIPAGKEILYGTFTMGYPLVRPRGKPEVEFYGLIRFRELDLTLRTEPQRLRVPARTGEAIITGDDHRQAAGSPAEWVKSDNGDLAIRLGVKSPQIAAKDNISVIAQIRNHRQSPVTILRPFADWYDAKAVHIKIWSKRGRIEYTGPEVDYVLDAKAFVTIGPGETVTETMELTNENFAGIGQAGTYTLRYDYEYDGSWDETVAPDGVKHVWRGRIASREIPFLKE